MRDLVRFAPFTFAIVLVACRRDGTPIERPDTGSKPITEVEGGGAELSITVVPQVPASEPLQWLFEPGGRRLSSVEAGDCSIWDIESGKLIRSLELIDPVPRECSEWLPAAGRIEFERFPTSADERLEVAIGPTTEIVDVNTGNTLRKLACGDCESADAVVWSASGHQLAFLWNEPMRLDIYDADTGKRVRSETIAAKGPLNEFSLMWTHAGPVVLLGEYGEGECAMDEDCEWDEDGNPLPIEINMRRALLASNQPGLVEIDLGSDQGSIDDLEFDPEGRWVYWTAEQDERRAGTTTWLYFVGLGEGKSGLGFERYDDYDDYAGSMSREGQWRVDGATHWAVAIRYDDFEGGFTGLNWETTLTSPPLGIRRGELVGDLQSYEADAVVDLFGFAGDTLRFAGEQCVEEKCTPVGTLPPRDCLILDVASNHGAELLDCGGRVQLRHGSSMVPLPLDAGSAFWGWARGGALVIDDGATFMVVDTASGRVGLQRDDVATMLDGKLGLELDRMVLLLEEGIELIDLSNLGVVLRRPDLDPIEVAFSPTGDRLAVLENDRITVLELPGGKPVASWPIQAVDQLAFRQDGKVVYTGSDRPDAGFDAASGEPLNDPLLFTSIAEAIDGGGEIDPSWRWIMHDEFHEMMRTIDGRVLAWNEGGVWLADTGQYGGKGPGPEIAYRIGSDPWTVPEFDSAQLAQWLAREDLEQAFLAGKDIAKPVITVAELEGLRAKVAGLEK